MGAPSVDVGYDALRGDREGSMCIYIPNPSCLEKLKVMFDHSLLLSNLCLDQVLEAKSAVVLALACFQCFLDDISHRIHNRVLARMCE